MEDFRLGAHLPNFTEEEIDLIHRVWLDVAHEEGLQGLQHEDIVAVALTRLRKELAGADRAQVLDQIRRFV